jgi:hypothetical protein
MRAEFGRVCAGVCGERGQAGTRVRVPDLDGPIPTARQKRVFSYEVPVHREDLPCMLLPGLYGEFGQVDVEELNGTITAGGEKLVLMRFRPSDVKERVLGVEPGERTLSGYIQTNRACDNGGRKRAPFLGHDTIRRQTQYVHPSITNKAKVR